MPPHPPGPPDEAQTWVVLTPELLRRRLAREEHLPDDYRAAVTRHAAAIESAGRTLAAAIDRLADPQEGGEDA